MSEKRPILCRPSLTIVILLLVLDRFDGAKIDKIVLVLPKGPKTLQMIGSSSPQLLHTISDVLKPLPSNVVQIPVPYYPTASKHRTIRKHKPKVIYKTHVRKPFVPLYLDPTSTQSSFYDAPFIPMFEPDSSDLLHTESPPEIRFNALNLLPLDPPNFRTVRSYVQRLKSRQKKFFDSHPYELEQYSRPSSIYPVYYGGFEPAKKHYQMHSKSDIEYVESTQPNELSYIGQANLSPTKENAYYAEPDAGSDDYNTRAEGHEFVIPPDLEFLASVERQQISGDESYTQQHANQNRENQVLKLHPVSTISTTPVAPVWNMGKLNGSESSTQKSGGISGVTVNNATSSIVSLDKLKYYSKWEKEHGLTLKSNGSTALKQQKGENVAVKSNPFGTTVSTKLKLSKLEKESALSFRQDPDPKNQGKIGAKFNSTRVQRGYKPSTEENYWFNVKSPLVSSFYPDKSKYLKQWGKTHHGSFLKQELNNKNGSKIGGYKAQHREKIGGPGFAILSGVEFLPLSTKHLNFPRGGKSTNPELSYTKEPAKNKTASRNDRGWPLDTSTEYQYLIKHHEKPKPSSMIPNNGKNYLAQYLSTNNNSSKSDGEQQQLHLKNAFLPENKRQQTVGEKFHSVQKVEGFPVKTKHPLTGYIFLNDPSPSNQWKNKYELFGKPSLEKYIAGKHGDRLYQVQYPDSPLVGHASKETGFVPLIGSSIPMVERINSENPKTSTVPSNQVQYSNQWHPSLYSLNTTKAENGTHSKPNDEVNIRRKADDLQSLRASNFMDQLKHVPKREREAFVDFPEKNNASIIAVLTTSESNQVKVTPVICSDTAFRPVVTTIDSTTPVANSSVSDSLSSSTTGVSVAQNSNKSDDDQQATQRRQRRDQLYRDGTRALRRNPDVEADFYDIDERRKKFKAMDFDDFEEEVRAYERFEPKKMYTQVRHQATTTRQQRPGHEPKIKEKVTISKTSIVYSEKGKEDERFDHGSEETFGEFRSVSKRPHRQRRKRDIRAESFTVDASNSTVLNETSPTGNDLPFDNSNRSVAVIQPRNFESIDDNEPGISPWKLPLIVVDNTLEHQGDLASGDQYLNDVNFAPFPNNIAYELQKALNGASASDHSLPPSSYSVTEEVQDVAQEAFDNSPSWLNLNETAFDTYQTPGALVDIHTKFFDFIRDYIQKLKDRQKAFFEQEPDLISEHSNQTSSDPAGSGEFGPTEVVDQNITYTDALSVPPNVALLPLTELNAVLGPRDPYAVRKPVNHQFNLERLKHFIQRPTVHLVKKKCVKNCKRRRRYRRRQRSRGQRRPLYIKVRERVDEAEPDRTDVQPDPIPHAVEENQSNPNGRGLDNVEEGTKVEEQLAQESTRTEEKNQSQPDVEPRMKEKVTISKTSIVYSEKGEADDQFDHGEEESSGYYHSESLKPNNTRTKRDVSANNPEDAMPPHGHPGSEQEPLPYAQALIFRNENDVLMLPLPESLIDPRSLHGDELLRFLDEAIHNSTKYLPAERQKKPIVLTPAIKRLQGQQLIHFLDEAIKTSNQYLMDGAGPGDVIKLVNSPRLAQRRGDHEIEILADVPDSNEFHREVFKFTRQNALPNQHNMVRAIDRRQNEYAPEDYEIEMEPQFSMGPDEGQWPGAGVIDNTTYGIAEGYIEPQDDGDDLRRRASPYLDVDAAVRYADNVTSEITDYLNVWKANKLSEMERTQTEGYAAIAIDEAYGNPQRRQTAVYTDVADHIKHFLSGDQTSGKGNILMITVPVHIMKNNTQGLQRRQDSVPMPDLTLPIFDISQFYPRFSFGGLGLSEPKRAETRPHMFKVEHPLEHPLEHQAEQAVENSRVPTTTPKQALHEERYNVPTYVPHEPMEFIRDIRFRGPTPGYAVPIQSYSVTEDFADVSQPAYKKPGPPYPAGGDSKPNVPSNPLISHKRGTKRHPHPSPRPTRTDAHRNKNYRRIPVVRKKIRYTTHH